MCPYNDVQNGNEPPVYSTGRGFYSSCPEPEWKREKRSIRRAGNGIGLAFIGYVLISIALSFSSYFAITFFTRFMSLSYETAEWTMSLITYIISLALPFGIYVLCIKMPVGLAFPFRKAKADLTFGGVLVGLGVGVVANYITTYLQIILESFGIGLSMPDLGVPTGTPALIIYLVMLTVAPAFIEEIVFRGVIMQSLRRFGDVFALITSSLIFGIFHLNLIQMPFAFILGLAIGFFVMRTGSIWVGVFIHLINNSIAALFTIAEPLLSESSYTMLYYIESIFVLLLGIIAFFPLIIKYKSLFKFAKAPGLLSSGKRVQYFLTSPALIVAMVIAVLMTLQYVFFI